MNINLIFFMNDEEIFKINHLSSFMKIIKSAKSFKKTI